MKAKFLLLSATLFGGVISTATFAATTEAPATNVRLEAPEPVEIVNPTRLALQHEGRTVELAMTVDENGRAQNIRILSMHDRNLRESLVTAVKQWQFKPATRNGTPVSAKVVLPLHLI